VLRMLVADQAETTASAHHVEAAAKGPDGGRPTAPILWLTSSEEPLAMPAIAQFTRQLQNAGHTIFLLTDGALLRRRIHEFRPDARLYITIRLYGAPHTHDRRVGRDGAFALAVEGLRAAQLSGFFVCAQVIVQQETQLHEISQLLEQLCSLNLDGLIITAENGADKSQRETAAAARGLIGSSWWASFSRLVQRSFDEPVPGVVGGFVASPQDALRAPSNAAGRALHDAPVSSEEVALQ